MVTIGEVRFAGTKLSQKIIKEKLDLQWYDHIPGSYCQSDFLFYLILYDEWF